MKFKIVQRVNPQDLLAERKYYAAPVVGETVNLKQLSNRIAGQCTVRPADCIAVLTALETNIQDVLAEGKVVQLGDLGTLRLSLSSEGVPTEEEVSDQLIKKLKVIYRPGEGLRKMLLTLRPKKLPKSA